MQTKTYSNYAIALTAALGLFMAILDNTIVNVALTPMATGLGTDLNSIQWVITGYFLSQAAIIPVAGYLSNHFGSKRVFILSLGFFIIGSLLCGLAQNETMLIFFRVLQGLGGGALFPLSQAIAFEAFPPAQRAGASAIIGVPVLLAPAFGPTIGGLITVSLDWRYIFFINVPVGIIAIYLAWRIFPPDKLAENRNRLNFDYIGLVLSILGVLAIVYAFTVVGQTQPGTQTAQNPRGELYGWSYWLVWVLLGGGAAILTVFAFFELGFSKDPVLDLRLFKSYNFTIASIISWLSAIVIFGSVFLVPVFLEQVRTPPLDALGAGLALMPQGLASAFTVALSGQLYIRLGVRNMGIIGSILLIISSWQLTHLSIGTSGLELLPWLVLRGFGFGLTAIPVQTLALQAISGPALAKGSSLFNVNRQIAISVGIAILSTLFVQQTAGHLADLPGQAGLNQLRSQAGTAGMNDVFFMVTIGTVILLLVSLALPNLHKQLQQRQEADNTQTEVTLIGE